MGKENGYNTSPPGREREREGEGEKERKR